MDAQKFDLTPLKIGFDDIFFVLKNAVKRRARNACFLADFGDVDRVIVVLP
jgi:hypothetical protein